MSFLTIPQVIRGYSNSRTVVRIHEHRLVQKNHSAGRISADCLLSILFRNAHVSVKAGCSLESFSQRLRKRFGILRVSTGCSSALSLFEPQSQAKIPQLTLIFSGIYATSRHIPGVRFAGTSHPGLIGTAPSKELLATWNARERTECLFQLFWFFGGRSPS